MKASTQDQLKEIMWLLSRAALDIENDKIYKNVLNVRDRIAKVVDELEEMPF